MAPTTPPPPSTPRLPSLPEVHASVATTQRSLWRRFLAFAGPAYVVSVGYMDPGNWATDLEGGARFGYQLLWVLVMSNAMAILLQTLSARLGIVAGLDLAQACRVRYPRGVSYALWGLCEVAIAACDLAEVLGAAIALNLLFGLPLLLGVCLTAADTLLLLWFSRFGIRWIEAVVLGLVLTIGTCLFTEMWWARPVVGDLVQGLVPRLSDASLYVAIGILGATVMPHNLYLHSALVQTRQIGASVTEKRSACRFNLVDSVVALNGALLVNGAILVLAASVFFTQGVEVTEIQKAHLLLAPLLGTAAASVLFAVALLAAGQSSTLTGTMAGQIVMEGFLNFRMRPWLRRLITRMVAVVPAALTIFLAGEQATQKLLILSQVVLSLQLPFAVIPLIHFTSDRARMGEFANRLWVKLLAWLVAAIIVGLNLRLAYTTLSDWLVVAGPWRSALLMLLVPAAVALLGLLAWVTVEPLLPVALRARDRFPVAVPPVGQLPVYEQTYQSILVPLDHSSLDSAALTHAASLAKRHNSRLYVLHVEEDVTSSVYGSLSSTAEVEAGRQYFANVLQALHRQSIRAELVIRYSPRPAEEIVTAAQTIQPDLIVMGAHGHRGVRDLVYGATINAVRHAVDAPLLIVRATPRAGGAAAPQDVSD